MYIKKLWIAVLLAMLVVLSLAGCGGQGEEQKAGPQDVDVVVETENAEVGKLLEAQGWEVTLIDQPEQTKRVGSGAASSRTASGDGFGGQSGSRDSEGIWLILTVEVVNATGEMGFIPKALLTVMDDQGGKYEPAGVTDAVASLINADERWERMENQLNLWVFEVGDAREGPLVFDVPEDATGLTLVMEGTDEIIDLGF